jgi:hypothetical protein
MELNKLSENVYKHFIRSAVPRVTEDEVAEILELYPGSNPLEFNSFIMNGIQSDDAPKEDPIDFFTNVTKMVLLSTNPIKKAYSLANEYISDIEDDLAEDESVEERARACELVYKLKVEFLREESEDEDIGDNWRHV